MRVCNVMAHSMIAGFRAWAVAAVVILVWGMTFANTRALLGDFSALEILVGRFALAWAALWVWEAYQRLSQPSAVRQPKAARRRWYIERCSWRDEWLFAGMGFCGIFCYQFLENCAIYYTNASNVAIFVSFGPIVTAALARMFAKDRTLSAALVVGSLIAVGGVALVSMNGVVNLHLRLRSRIPFQALCPSLRRQTRPRRNPPLPRLRRASCRASSARPSRSQEIAASAMPFPEKDFAFNTGKSCPERIGARAVSARIADCGWNEDQRTGRTRIKQILMSLNTLESVGGPSNAVMGRQSDSRCAVVMSALRRLPILGGRGVVQFLRGFPSCLATLRRMARVPTSAFAGPGL